jgi:hypothetical protein
MVTGAFACGWCVDEACAEVRPSELNISAAANPAAAELQIVRNMTTLLGRMPDTTRKACAPESDWR